MSCPFFEVKSKESHQKSRDFSLLRTPKIPGKEEENAPKKARNSVQMKKTRTSQKKQGVKEDQGFRLDSRRRFPCLDRAFPV